MEEKSRLLVGVVGAGGVGTKLLQTFHQHPRTEIVAVCDANPDRAQEVSALFQLPNWYTNDQDMSKNEKFDILYVAVPPKFHHEVVLRGLASGKHILCEKPLANSIQESEEMLTRAEQVKVVHAMNFPTYFRPAGVELRRLLTSGAIGKIRRIELNLHFHLWPRPWQQNNWINTREQGGFTREVVPHYLQFLHRLFPEVVGIRSELEFTGAPTDSETGLLATCTLADGTLFLINGVSGIAQQEHLSFTVYGTDGTVSLQNWSELLTGGPGEALKPVALPEKDHLLDLVDHFVRAIDGDPSADCITFAEGHHIQILLESLLSQSGGDSVEKSTL